MEILTWKLFLVFLTWINILTVTNGNYCYNDKKHEDIIQGIVGENLNITCILIGDSYKECQTYDYKIFHGIKELPPSDINFINQTVIKFTLRNPEEMYGNIQKVQCGNYTLTADKINIGTPPQNVTDFYCRFYHRNYIICRAKVIPNNLRVDYKLEYRVKEVMRTCNENVVNGTNFYCKFSKYVIGSDYDFNFTLTGSNYAGNNTQIFIINHGNNVVPKKPSFEVVNITSRSIILYSFNPAHQSYSSLRYHIRYKPENFEWNDTYVNKNSTKNTSIRIDLDYAFRKYDLEVKVRSNDTKHNDDASEIWSDPFTTTFRTLPRRPDNPPEIDSGGYYIDSSGYIFLYWKRLNKYYQNAENFNYVITEVQINQLDVELKPIHITPLYAKFTYDPRSNYKFNVKSKNSMGLSVDTSSIYVPERNFKNEDYLPRGIFKVYNKNNSSYNISWTPPINSNGLISYTVFWCDQQTETNDACKQSENNSINFKRVDNNQTWYFIAPQINTLNLAVSANYKNYSSGMTWATCSKPYERDYLPLTPELMPVSSTEIKVTWNLECSEKSNANKYNFTYCPIVSNLSCLENNTLYDDVECPFENQTTKTVVKNEREFRILDLLPYTRYKVSIILYSETKNGTIGKSTTVCTYQDAPTAPRNLSVKDVSESEATLTWLPPDKNNGVFQSYTIRYRINDKNDTQLKTIENVTVSDKDSPSFKLNNLLSYTKYTVYVTGKTIKESEPQIISFETKIGQPSSPVYIKRLRNNDFFKFIWEEPKHPRGRIDFYEIKAIFQEIEGNNYSIGTKLEITSRVKSKECKFIRPPCGSTSHLLNFTVSAVNVAEFEEFSIPLNEFSRKRRLTNADISVTGKNQVANYNLDIMNDKPEQNLQTDQPDYNTKSTRQIQYYNKGNLLLIKKMFGDKFNQPLQCENHINFDKYNDNQQYKLLKSAVSFEDDNYCYFEPKTNKAMINNIILHLSVVSFVVMFISVFYIGGKKYKKMKNIEYILPAGLTDVIEEDNSLKCPDILKTIDGNIPNNELVCQKEVKKSKEEKRHLLDSTGNDSGSSTDYNAEEQETQSQREDDSGGSTVEMMDYSNSSYAISPSQSPQNSIRDMELPSETKELKPVILTNGYVEPKSIQSPAERTFSGYTTLDAISKPVIQSQSNFDVENNKIINTTSNLSPTTIGGYVTQKQLSEFGRLQ